MAAQALAEFGGTADGSKAPRLERMLSSLTASHRPPYQKAESDVVRTNPFRCRLSVGEVFGQTFRVQC